MRQSKLQLSRDSLCCRGRVDGRTRRRRSIVFFLVFATGIAQLARADDQKKAAAEFDCLIQPKMVLKLGTPVPGLISEVLVDRGAMVKKGDVVARLESGVEEAAVALAKARAQND